MTGGFLTRGRAVLPGLAVVGAGSVLASLLGGLVPLVGAPVFGLVIGALAGAVVPRLRSASLTPGYGLAGRFLLQAAIVVLGTGLSLRQVITVGRESLPVMIGTLIIALVGGAVLGRLFRLDSETTLLITVGTAICGASAIAATSAVIKPRDRAIGYAIGTIFTFNVAAVMIFPPLGHLLGLDPAAFGRWSGTAVNDTSSVVATAYAFNPAAGPQALVVKLARSLMIIPIVLVIAVINSRNRSGAERPTGRPQPWRLVPPFLIGFLVAAGLQTLGLIPASWQPALAALGLFLITAALTGIGLSLRLADLRRSGPKPLLLGALLWIAVAAASLGLQAATGQL
ncbi:YeiH family protein [Microlunatus parietis]|uniref:Putative integral membrane protein (TIGR00698 family) n=1 Tax=Microlunatus parietis TaxID=682979 RepID=A0A7Y9IF43_9ACTN|nr:putative sulfate exporter family transporter [Microlunatus parietis]NYE75665.1 putative integral membrane protein (TIGR00698 family) [Microlunatus parietis]